MMSTLQDENVVEIEMSSPSNNMPDKVVKDTSEIPKDPKHNPQSLILYLCLSFKESLRLSMIYNSGSF